MLSVAEKKFLERVAESVRGLRARDGLTIEGLGSKTGLSHMTVRRIERAENVNLDSVQHVADYFGLTVSELAGELPGDDSRFIAELRSLEARLDDRGREAVLAVARSQANIKPAVLGPATRRAMAAAEADAARLADNDQRVERADAKPAASGTTPRRRTTGRG